jgi:hypothetical protein
MLAIRRRRAAMPACYLYVLPLQHEDILKLGISVDPLARARAFARRWYECFDVSRSILVGFDSVPEARRREAGLHRQLRPWRGPCPLTVPVQAGGHTEWYRGALPVLHEEAGRDRERGHPVHLPALEWWRRRLQEEQPLLYEWAQQCLADVHEDGLQQTPLWPGIVDVLDAWPALRLGLDGALPDPLAAAYRDYRDAWRQSLSHGHPAPHGDAAHWP